MEAGLTPDSVESFVGRSTNRLETFGRPGRPAALKETQWTGGTAPLGSLFMAVGSTNPVVVNLASQPSCAPFAQETSDQV